MTEVEFAEQLARWMHRDQTDKSDKPYVGHLERVAAAVSDEAKAAAWLHDIVEDKHLMELDLKTFRFSFETLNAVLFLTKMRTTSYQTYIYNMRPGQPRDGDGRAIAREVKIADLRDNLNEDRRYEGDEPNREKYIDALEVLGAEL